MNKQVVLVSLILIAANVYLFASRPESLPEIRVVEGEIPVEQLFRTVAWENDVVRGIWTKRIVGDGKKAGLKFDEDWRRSNVQAGPLPALFLREAAASLEKNPVRLGLFLGSDFPISTENSFAGKQVTAFERIRENGEPQFFVMEDTQLQTAMFADVAIADACVTCHNDHPESPKTDWILNDLMGATTWSYPNETLTMGQYVAALNAMRNAFREGYSAYLDKTRSFDNPPEIGLKWPKDGYYLPSLEVFMAEAERQSSWISLGLILQAEQSAK